MEIKRRLLSKDGSLKYLIKLKDNTTIETLYMYDKDFKLTCHSTVCVSSQVGCRLECKFCATGKQGFVRNLSKEEIKGQVHICNNHCLESGIIPIDAVVFAGMGEPLLNYENVKASINDMSSEFGINNYEIVTVGIIPNIHKMIKDFADKNFTIRLNLSLHASENEQRKKLIPFTSIYDINAIINEAVDFAKAFNTQIRVRYTLFKGLNDTDEDIERLSALLADKPVKLIISQYNDNDIPGLITPNESDIQEFFSKMNKRIDCGIFYNFGTDIRGGCGQLRQEEIT